MNIFLHQNKNNNLNLLKKIILILIPFCLVSIPIKAFAETDKEKMWYGFYNGVIGMICKFYKEGYLPEEYAKENYKYWYSSIDEKIKTNNVKDRLIKRGNKDPKCRHLMP